VGVNALETNRADTAKIKIQKRVWRCGREMLGKLKTWLKSDGIALDPVSSSLHKRFKPRPLRLNRTIMNLS